MSSAASMIKDNPLKSMLQFALPLLVGNLLQQTYNIIDAAIVGQTLGAEALAAVGSSSSVQFLVLGFCMGSCAGFGIPIAKYFGAEKYDTMRRYIFNGGVLTAMIAAIVTVLCMSLCNWILQILSVPGDIFANAYAYLLVIFIGLPFTLLYNYLSSILRAVGAIGSMVMQSANNSLGSIYVSGFTAAVKIKQFALCPFDAMATAVSVFCSQNLGAGQAKRIRQGLFQGMVVAVGYGIFAGLVLIVFGRSLSMMFLSRDNVEVLDASAKYLRCMGFFYWSLGILNVSRMVTQGLGFSGRAFFSGVTEMIARIIVSVGFVGTFGYTAICFADQTAWVSACCYIFPTCLYCMKKVTKLIQSETPAQADSLHA